MHAPTGIESSLATFVPADVRSAIAGGVTPPERRHGSVLEADVSGFTPLTEALAQRHGPQRGAEEVAAVLDRVYAPLITEVDRAGGSVVEFLGDAIACCFDADDGTSALRCGLAMQQAIVARRRAGAAPPAVKVVVASGSFLRFSVGDPRIRLMEVLAGPAVAGLAAIAPLARGGEVVVDGQTAARLGARIDVGEWRGTGPARAALVTAIAGGARDEDDAPPPLITSAAARPWLPAAVLERLRDGGEELLGELRTVVALFVRFGTIDDARDVAREQFDAYARFAQATIEGLGGTLFNVAVDAKGCYVCAGFGAPVAYDDDPLRAATAALVLRTPPEGAGRFGPGRVGIARGRLYAGAYGGPTRRTFGLQGSTANLAARLMHSAREGQILVEESLARRIEQRHELRPLAALDVKGRSAPVAVRELLAPTRGASPPLAALAAPALVNRIEERTRCERLVRALSAGSGGVAVLEGEPGIGKSRLVGHLVEYAAAEGIAVHAGAGDPIERGAPYHGWRGVFEQALGLQALPEDPREQRDRVLARLAGVRAAGGGDGGGAPVIAELSGLLSAVLQVPLPDSPATASLTGEARAEATRDLLAQTLAALARSAPTLVVLEDAHWLDSASLALALRLALAPGPLLLVLTTRPLAEVAPSELSRLVAVSGCEHVSVGPLPASETLELARNAAGQRLPAPVATLIEAKAGGNPLFTRELVHALRDDGLLVDAAGRRAGSPFAEQLRVESPDTVEAVIASRVDRLPAGVQAVLKVGSVLGLSFSDAALRELAGAGVDDRLAVLERLDLVARDGAQHDGGWVFRHALIHDVVYARLLHAQRRELHRRAAEHYERAGGGRVTHAALAHHWERAEEPARAAEYLATAGEEALRTGAARECVDALARALELSPPDGAGRRAEWTWYMAQACYRLGELERSIALGAEAIATLDRPVPSSTAGVVAGAARELARQAVHRLLAGRLPRRVPPTSAQRTAVEAQLIMAEVYYVAADKTRSSYVALRSLNLAERLGPSTELAQCYGALCIIAGIVGAHRLAERYGRLARETAARIDDPYTVAHVIHQVGMYRSSRGPYASFGALYADGIAGLRALGHKPRLRDALGIAGVGDHIFGRPAEAERKLTELLATVEPQEMALWAQWAPGWLGAVALRCGRPEEALVRLRRSAELSRGQAFDMTSITIRALTALALWRTGEDDGAAAEERAAWALVEQLGRRPTGHLVLDGYAALAELSLARWDAAGSSHTRRLARRHALSACRNLRAFARAFGVGVPVRWLYEAERHWRLGDRERALRMWRRSRAAAARLDMRYELALAHAALGDRLPAGHAPAQHHRASADALLRELGVPCSARAVTPRRPPTGRSAER